MRRLIVVVAVSVVVVGAIALAVVSGGGSTSGYSTKATSFVLPRLSQSGKVSLTSFQGEPVVVNFFASWCTACRAEAPAFDHAATALRGRVAFIEVNALETGDAARFARQYGLFDSATAVLHDVGGGQGSGLYQALGGNGAMPMTAFYNAGGSLLDSHSGSLDAASLARSLSLFDAVTVPS